MDKRYIRYIMLGRGFGKTQVSLQELINRCEQLEKALDKACNLIGENMNCPLGVYDKQYPFCKGWECDNNGARCWKEWLLKEVQENE